MTLDVESTATVYDVAHAAALNPEQLLSELRVLPEEGLADDEVSLRQSRFGVNAVSSHRARPLLVLWHQLNSPLLALLLLAAVASFIVGEHSSAVIIAIIVAVSVGLGFVNEYRAERTAQALHSQIHHETLARRGGRLAPVDVTSLVPGDLIKLRLGDIVPAMSASSRRAGWSATNPS